MPPLSFPLVDGSTTASMELPGLSGSTVPALPGTSILRGVHYWSRGKPPFGRWTHLIADPMLNWGKVPHDERTQCLTSCTTSLRSPFDPGVRVHSVDLGCMEVDKDDRPVVAGSTKASLELSGSPAPASPASAGLFTAAKFSNNSLVLFYSETKTDRSHMQTKEQNVFEFIVQSLFSEKC